MLEDGGGGRERERDWLSSLAEMSRAWGKSEGRREELVGGKVAIGDDGEIGRKRNRTSESFKSIFFPVWIFWLQNFKYEYYDKKKSQKKKTFQFCNIAYYYIFKKISHGELTTGVLISVSTNGRFLLDDRHLCLNLLLLFHTVFSFFRASLFILSPRVMMMTTTTTMLSAVTCPQSEKEEYEKKKRENTYFFSSLSFFGGERIFFISTERRRWLPFWAGWRESL